MTNTSDLPDIRQQLGDRYVIERELGRGGMGAVYLAHAIEDRDGVLAFAMGFVEGERETQRQQLRADPDARRRRRKTVIIALLQLPIAILLIKASLNVRLSLGTKVEVVQTESREPTGGSLGRLTMAGSGLSLLGVSFLLLARSPFRMPPGERLFRVMWLGAPGRAFVRFPSRNVTPPSSGKTAPGLAPARANVNIASTGRAAAPVVAATALPTDRMRSLEDRVAALERWRDGAKT